MAKKTKTRPNSRSKTTRSRTTPNPSSQRDRERPSGYALQDDRVEAALITGDYRDLLEDYFGEDVYEELMHKRKALWSVMNFYRNDWNSNPRYS